MNCKGTAVIAVTFPNGKTGKAIIAEYPQCITIFCRVHSRVDIHGILEVPDIDVEVFRMSRTRYAIRGRGIHEYWDQISFIMDRYCTAKIKFIQNKGEDLVV